MKRIILLAAALVALLPGRSAYAQIEGSSFFQNSDPFTYTENPDLQKLLPTPAQRDSASYMMGVNFGMSLYGYHFEGMNVDEIMEGLKAVIMAGGDSNDIGKYRISPQHLSQILGEYSDMLSNYICQRNKDEGKAFEEYYLKHYRASRRTGGIIFRELIPGEASRGRIHETDTVVVNYELRNIHGELLDKGEKASFALNRVVEGFRDGVSGMGRRQLAEFVVPSDLAYGDRGIGNGKIQPGATLVFKVELLSVRKDESSGDNTGKWLY